MPPKARPAIERVLARIDTTVDGCWLWPGSKDRHGYGQVRVYTNGDGTNRLVYTHRVTYEHFVGPIPEGLQLDHLCRVPLCCNPAHLEAVTQRENILRGVSPSSRAARQTHCGTCGAPFGILPSGRRRCFECRDRKRAEARKGRMRSECSKCGGPYSVSPSGDRRCRPCKNARQRRAA